MSMLTSRGLMPARNINFLHGHIPPDFSIVRATPKCYVSPNGSVVTAAPNVPTFSWRNGACKGLLVHPPRTNLIKKSKFIDSVMTTSLVTDGWNHTYRVTAEYDVPSPDGKNDAVRITREETTSQFQYVRYSLGESLEDDKIYTFSFFIKPVTSFNTSIIFCSDRPAANRVHIAVNLEGQGAITEHSYETKNVTFSQAGVERVDSEWYRVWVSARFNKALTHVRDYSVIVYTSVRGAQVTGDCIDLWGFVLEDGDLPTSYISTNGAVATTSGDLITSTDTMLYGSIVVSYDGLYAGKSQTELSLAGLGNFNDQTRLHIRSDGDTRKLVARFRRNNIDLFNYYFKEIPKDKDGSIGLSINGGVAHISDGESVHTINKDFTTTKTSSGLVVGSWLNLVEFTGAIKNIALYDKPLTQEELRVAVKLRR